MIGVYVIFCQLKLFQAILNMLNVQLLFIWLDRVYTSCTEALYWNWKKYSTYAIRHREMVNVVLVECKLVENKITAILHHDTEMQIEVHGYEASKSYK